jgi:hypothetical protein
MIQMNENKEDPTKNNKNNASLQQQSLTNSPPGNKDPQVTTSQALGSELAQSNGSFQKRMNNNRRNNTQRKREKRSRFKKEGPNSDKGKGRLLKILSLKIEKHSLMYNSESYKLTRQNNCLVKDQEYSKIHLFDSFVMNFTIIFTLISFLKGSEANEVRVCL